MMNIKLLLSLSVIGLSFYGNAQSACFTSANDNVYSAPANGRCIVKEDFDNDGDLDIVMGNYTGAPNGTLPRLNFIENNGDATFQAPVSFASGSLPLDVKASDFDNDGNMDVAVVNFNLSRVAVALGNGDGTFQAPVAYTTQSGPNRIVIADFNNDGEEDLAITTNAGSVNVLLADAGTPGTFFAYTQFNLNFGANALGINAGDFNGDGNIDIVTANNGNGNASILEGDGLGGFAVPVDYATDIGCYSVVVQDLDGDSNLDIITSNDDANNVSVLINDGAGSFDPAVNYAAGVSTIALEVDDFNNDTNWDIVTVNNQSNSISVLLGNGDGTLQPQNQFAAIGSPRNIVTGDFNADSNNDVVLSCLVGQVMPVFLGNGSGTFSLGTSITVGSQPKSLYSADFDQDGNIDFVVANSNDNTATVHAGLGNGDFTLQSTLTTGNNPSSVVGADVDGNGFEDVIVTNYDDGNVTVFMNASGVFSAGSNFTCNATPIMVEKGDFNNDGDTDIVVLNENNQFSILLGNGAGGLGAPTSLATGNDPLGIDVGDVNGDNFDDVVVANSSDNDISIYTNDGAGGFLAPVDRNVGTTPTSVTFGDLTNDGAPEIVTTNYASNNISVTINNGAGLFAFGSATYSSSDSGPQDAVIADFDGDGNNDVMAIFEVSVASTGYASIFMGDGAGSLNFFQRFSTGMNPVGVVNNDFNNDTKQDVGVVNFGSDNVSILLNTTASATALGPTTFCDGGDVDLQSDPSSSYLWSNSATTQTITVTTSGSYTVQTSEGASGWCTTTSTPIVVTVNPSPTITVSGTNTICNGASTTLTASGASTYSWDNGLGTGDTKNVSPISTTTYNVTGTDANGCVSIESVLVTVNNLPDASFTGLAGSYCLDDASVTLNPNVAGGTFTGAGISANNFDPTAATAGTHEIKYIITDGNGCTDSTSQNTTVDPLPDASFSGLAANYCEDASIVTLSPATSGGTFTGNGISGNNFDPSIANIGNNNIQYSVTDGNGCSASSSQSVNINALPDADFDLLDPDYCQDGNTVSLVPNQSGGSFSGDGVSGTTFDPNAASTGNIMITYNITDGNGCSNSSNQSTIVNSLPDATFTGANPEYCEDAGSVPLTPAQAGGTFSGDGVSSNVFNPPLANIGTNEIKYIITDGNGCTDSTSQTVTVHALPNTNFSGLLTEYCQDDPASNLVPVQAGGVFIGSGVSSGQFDPSIATPGSVNVTYSITDANNCFNSTTENTTVYALPDADFTTLNAEYCEDEAPINLVPNESGGTFSGDGLNSNTFDPSLANIGNNTINYDITDANGCSNSSSQIVIVNALPDSVFTGLDTAYCQNEDFVTLVPNESGGTFTGIGIANGNEFHPNTVPVGMNAIQYSITNASNCSASSSQLVEILELPDTTIGVTDLIIEAQAMGPNITYQWIDCDNGGAPILGETNQMYEVTQNGNYAVIVTNEHCSDTSSCVEINYVSVPNFREADIKLYPNPNNGEFNIELSENSLIEIYNPMGQLIYRSNHEKGMSIITLEDSIESGVYMLKVLSDHSKFNLQRIIIQH